MSNPAENETELVIAVVAAVGAEIDLVVEQISTALSEYKRGE